MKEEKYEKFNLLDDINDNINNKTKIINFKIIIIFILIILFLFGLGIIANILINQSKRIIDLSNQIKNLSNKSKHDISSINDKINYFYRLNDTINNLEIQIDEKEKEIQLLKINLQKKDNEIQLSNQKINNLKILLNNSLIYYDNSLNENNKEIQMLKIVLSNSLDNFENLLTEKNQEIELLTQNSNSLDKMNEELNRNVLDIQRVKQLESNIALLLNFKVKIKADFYIDNRQVHLCSHKYYDIDRIDDSRIKLSANRDDINGCIWKVYQHGNSLGFMLFDSDYGMNGWTIKIKK